MNFIKGLLTLIGAIVVIAGIVGAVKVGPSVAKLHSDALPEYMKMFDKVLTTGDPAKGMVRKAKMVIPEGMTKAEAFENALEIMDEVAEEYGMALVDSKTMPREGKLFKDGGLLTHIRSYCSPYIADVFLNHSREFVAFMPCRIGFVEEPNGDIYLYTMSMELLLHGGFVLDPEIYELGNEVRTGMYTMMEKAAAGESD
ncbi:DUF302 domain-containing protein [Sulfurovum sp.]|uniref:DUF302 domain-containing protein n=1 Tax=Sulfurovum sp. TaxID=1969726 RepID=UPI002867DACE|nr:DUF302 domain-containing protein [Sulfurovum sp.]